MELALEPPVQEGKSQFDLQTARIHLAYAIAAACEITDGSADGLLSSLIDKATHHQRAAGRPRS